jgi:hypothetical protein
LDSLPEEHQHRRRRAQEDDRREVEGARGVNGGAAAWKRDLGRVGHHDHEDEQEYFRKAREREIANQIREEEETGGDESEVVEFESDRRIFELTLQGIT